MKTFIAILLLLLTALGCATSDTWRDPAYRDRYRDQRAIDRCCSTCAPCYPDPVAPPRPRRIETEDRG